MSRGGRNAYHWGPTAKPEQGSCIYADKQAVSRSEATRTHSERGAPAKATAHCLQSAGLA